MSDWIGVAVIVLVVICAIIVSGEIVGALDRIRRIEAMLEDPYEDEDEGAVV